MRGMEREGKEKTGEQRERERERMRETRRQGREVRENEKEIWKTKRSRFSLQQNLVKFYFQPGRWKYFDFERIFFIKKKEIDKCFEVGIEDVSFSDPIHHFKRLNWVIKFNALVLSINWWRVPDGSRLWSRNFLGPYSENWVIELNEWPTLCHDFRLNLWMNFFGFSLKKGYCIERRDLGGPPLASLK